MSGQGIKPLRWPPKVQVVDQILALAEPYALAVDNEHPEDVANSLIVAIEVAWRAVKPLGDDT